MSFDQVYRWLRGRDPKTTALGYAIMLCLALPTSPHILDGTFSRAEFVLFLISPLVGLFGRLAAQERHQLDPGALTANIVNLAAATAMAPAQMASAMRTFGAPAPFCAAQHASLQNVPECDGTAACPLHSSPFVLPPPETVGSSSQEKEKP